MDRSKQVLIRLYTTGTRVAAVTHGKCIYSDTLLGLKKYKLYCFLPKTKIDIFIYLASKFYHYNETEVRDNDHIDELDW